MANLDPPVIWTIQRNRPDHPDKFVVQRLTGTVSEFVAVCDTLFDARRQMPPNLYRMRSDDPSIVEVWT